MLESIPDKTIKGKTTAGFCLHPPRESQTFEFGGTNLSMTFTSCMYYAHVNPRFMQNNQPITSEALVRFMIFKGSS